MREERLNAPAYSGSDMACLAAGLLAPLSIAAANLGLGLVSLTLLFSLARAQEREETASRLRASAREPLFLALAAYCVASLLSGLAGVSPRHSLSLLPKDIHKLWVVLALGAVLEGRRRTLFAKALLAGAVFAALVGIVQTLATAAALGAATTPVARGVAWSFMRARAFVHPVAYGEILGLSFLGVLFADSDLLSPITRHGAIVALTLALVFNQTRAVALALVAACGVAALADLRWRRLFYRGLLLIAIAAAAWEMLPMGRSVRDVLSGGIHGPHAARLTLWKVGAGIFLDHPWTGVGPGGYRAVFPAYFDGTLDGQRVWGSAHNLIIHQAAERGLVGLAALAAVCAALVSGLRAPSSKRPNGWFLWSLSATAAFLFMNMTEAAFQTEQVATLFLAIWLLGREPSVLKAS